VTHKHSCAHRLVSHVVSTLVVCVGAALLVPSLMASLDASGESAASVFDLSSQSSGQPQILGGRLLEDPPDSLDDDGDDDVLGSAVVMPSGRSPGAAPRKKFLPALEPRPTRLLATSGHFLRAPPR
jgi:hypothetical protein